MSILHRSTMVVDYPDPPRPVIVLSPGQYKTKTAYHFDPLLKVCVVVEQPKWLPRLNGEQ